MGGYNYVQLIEMGGSEAKMGPAARPPQMKLIAFAAGKSRAVTFAKLVPSQPKTTNGVEKSSSFPLCSCSGKVQPNP
jgi:hypothetical protein